MGRAGQGAHFPMAFLPTWLFHLTFIFLAFFLACYATANCALNAN